jgi:hypothetical protein
LCFYLTHYWRDLKWETCFGQLQSWMTYLIEGS